MESPCPCQSGRSYTDCCGPLLEGVSRAETAEQLMRSRYSAFAIGNAQYLLNTLHPNQRQPDEFTHIKSGLQNIEWTGLTIVDRESGEKDDIEGIVEFVAQYQLRGQPGRLHERSRFLFEQNQWFYLDGIHPPEALPGRNAPCWCGSGKKYKKCHAMQLMR